MDDAHKTIEEARNRLAHALNLIESVVFNVELACQQQGWNDEVIEQIKEAAGLLAFPMATLVTWDYDEENSTDKR